MQPGDVKATSADTKLLEQLIDFKPNTSVAVGIKNFVDWYRDFYEVYWIEYLKNAFSPDKNRCTIAVIGLGYVGLPVAVEFANQKISFVDNKELNHKIIGFDINENRINELRKGFDKTCEINESDINKLENIIFIPVIQVFL